ncbi:MAG: GNAT family N-acetyltransferase [Proteobacteria bacterium]|nr:GNAT family N-acetyltransferase [Pseudomonadota bacterium]
MSRATTSCKIIADRGDVVTRFVCEGLGYDTGWLDEHFTIGFMLGNRLVGGLIYHNIRPGRDVWWTLYTTDKRWCSKRILKFMFGLAFEYFGCRRISMSADADNAACLKLALKLGFKAEGLLRSYRDNGKDCIIMGILNNEYKLKGTNKCQKA